jgi:hypothetical protein
MLGGMRIKHRQSHPCKASPLADITFNKVKQLLIRNPSSIPQKIPKFIPYEHWHYRTWRYGGALRP